MFLVDLFFTDEIDRIWPSVMTPDNLNIDNGHIGKQSPFANHYLGYPCWFSVDFDNSSYQFLIQEPVQVLVVGGVEVSVHRLAGDKNDVIFWRYKTRDMDIWRCENRWISIARFRLTWHVGWGCGPVFWGVGSRKVFFSMFFDQAERQRCKWHSCKVVEDRAGQIWTWWIGWWVPRGWIHSIHCLRTYQVVPQIWNNWLVNLE